MPVEAAASARYPWVENAESNERINDNLRLVWEKALESAEAKEKFSLDLLKSWHTTMLAGVPVAEPEVRGRFRGEGGPTSRLARCEVQVDDFPGLVHEVVHDAMRAFETALNDRLADLGSQAEIRVADVVELCAWGHSELIRVHPFANGNGRMARVLGQWIGWRFGLPAFIRAAPRPDSVEAPQPGPDGKPLNAYEVASAVSMNPSIPLERKHLHLTRVFRQMLNLAISEGR